MRSQLLRLGYVSFAFSLQAWFHNLEQIVLIGESVDVDVDEPSITIRWSILACGPGYVLPESSGIHGSDSCGLPTFPILIFVDK